MYLYLLQHASSGEESIESSRQIGEECLVHKDTYEQENEVETLIDVVESDIDGDEIDNENKSDNERDWSLLEDVNTEQCTADDDDDDDEENNTHSSRTFR